jgi:hypothetical protein
VRTEVVSLSSDPLFVREIDHAAPPYPGGQVG